MPDAFHERQYKSQRDRYLAAAKMALESLRNETNWALKQMDSGDVPNSNLEDAAHRFGQAISQVIAIDELKAVFDTTDGAEQ